MLHYFLLLLARLVTSVSNEWGLYHICFAMEVAMPNGIDETNLEDVLVTTSFWEALNVDMNDLNEIDPSLFAPLFANHQPFCKSHREEIEEMISAYHTDEGTNEHAENMMDLMIAEALLLVQDAEVLLSSEGSRRNLVFGIIVESVAEFAGAVAEGMEVDQAGYELESQTIGNRQVTENWERLRDLGNAGPSRAGGTARYMGVAPEPADINWNPSVMDQVVDPYRQQWINFCKFWCPATVAATVGGGQAGAWIGERWWSRRRDLETSSYDITAESILGLCAENVNSFICNVNLERLVLLMTSDLCGTADTGLMTCTVTEATIEHELEIQQNAIAALAEETIPEVKIAAEMKDSKRLRAANKALRSALEALEH